MGAVVSISAATFCCTCTSFAVSLRCPSPRSGLDRVWTRGIGLSSKAQVLTGLAAVGNGGGVSVEGFMVFLVFGAS